MNLYFILKFLHSILFQIWSFFFVLNYPQIVYCLLLQYLYKHPKYWFQLKPLLITIAPFFLSEKIVRQPSCVPTSVPKTIPPIAGEITTSGFWPSNSSAIIIEKAVRYSGYCKTFAHWKYLLLCFPELKIKCPSRRAPVSLKIFKIWFL